MKRQGRLFAIIITCMIALVLLTGLYPQTALADSYTSTTMRLLRFEGNVEIEDASGKPRAVMENARLSSGESMKTAAASSASVGLDEGRIVTLDEKSRVEFKKQDGAVSMNLTEGKIFLDVSEKLGEGESMGVTTATMAIGIRGTIIYASCMPVTDENAAQMESVDLEGLSPEKGHIVSISQIGVLEGTAQITYTDNSNRQQTVAVEAGKKATVPEYSEDAEGIPEPAVSDLTKEDIEGFVKDQVASSASIVDRVQEACDVADDIDITDLAGLYTADGDWTWDSPVTLVAQSASKYYDGQPLTRSSDILVDGLPSIFTVKASAGGSRTDAGESDNPVDNYAIYNKAGQDVTRHFTKINTVSGTLLVVPAPLTIHTGTAEKVYDGTVLTEPDAYITFYKGGDSREVPWRNTSYVVTEPAANVSYDNQTLYGICGVIWVNAANPLTGERREIQLKAGQKLTVFISDLAGKQSIELKIEKLTENDLPAELLRLYADNPALLEQACKDAGWNISLIRGRIEALTATSSGGAASGDAMIEQGGLMIRESESDRLMQNLTNVRITVDTDITDYNNRALGSEEAHYSGLAVDESIKVTPTGRQTDVGTSVNTYTIDWGTADRSNYEVSEDLGTLTVTPASATITTGSASKTYDGTPLTNSEASISGLVAGETATVTATGTITEPGTTVNTYTIDWGTAAPSNYTVSESLGTLRVTPAAPTPYGAVTLTAASASKTYDGTALTADSFTVSAAESLPSGSTANSEGLPSDSALNAEGLPSGSALSAEGLPSGFTVSATVSGSQTDVGSSANTITSYTIYDADGNDVTGQFPDVTLQSGTLIVNPAELTISTGSSEKEYDGTPLTSSEASISGLVDGEAATVVATGSITDVGSTENTYSISWDSADSGNYTVTESLGTLRVTAQTAPVTLTAASSDKTYDGAALTSDSFTAEGLPSDFTVSVSVSGSQTDAGNNANTIDSYTIYNPDGSDVTEYFSNITAQNGTLTVYPAEVTISTGSAEKEFDGTPLTSSEASISGLVDGETATVAANGSITEVGSTENTYSISWDSADSGNYTVSESLGTLRVTAQTDPVTLTAASADKIYDGTALTNSSVIAEGLPSGFTVSTTVSGSQTDAGNSANTIDSYTIYNPDGKDVTDYFSNITAENGKLVVAPKEVTITTGSDDKEYDGTPLTNSEASISGLVSGETATVAANGSITEVGSTENTYSISWDSADSGNYTVSESLGTLQVTAQTSPVTLTAASVSKTYDGAALTSDLFTAEGLPSDFTVSVSISGSQTDAGNSANTIDSYTIYDFDGSDVTDYFSNIITQDGALTITPAEVTITTGSAEKEYDGTPLASSEVSISGLVSGETATVAASGSITDVGSTENTYSISWDSADSGNYTVSESLGTLRVTAQTSPVTLTAASADKIYDGTALTNSSVTAEGLPSGFTVSTIVSGSQTDAGNSANTIDSYTIYNSNGKDVTDYFSNITAKNGKLVVAPKEVTITTGSDDKEYDGTPLTNSEASISGLVSGETATVAANGSITDVGSTENTYSISWDSADSGNYTVNESLGTLAVNPLQVVFDIGFRGEDGPEIEDDMGSGGSGDGGSDSPVVFEYMGHPYFPEWILASYKGADEPVEPVDWHMDGETGTFSFTYALPGGAKLQLNGTGYTDAGSYTLEPEGTFLEGNKDNYKITFINNSLEITPAALTITASASKEYDGEPLVGSDAVKIEGLAEGESISVTATGKITNAGTADNPYTVDWLDTNPNNYTVTQEPGILEVTAKKVTITTGSAEKVYDGETLFYNNYELSPSDPWVNGQAPKITVTGSITNAGIKPNTCMVEWKGVNPNNYAVTQELGTLTVRPVDILLISNCQYGVSGTISILEYGLKAQVNNLESTRYEVPQMGENRWWLQFEWGDKVEVQIVVTIDETSYAITPIHDFILGDSGNYKISTQDQAGELDTPPVYPIDGFSMGKPSTFSIVADRSLAAVSELADTIISNQVDLPDDSDDEDDDQQELEDEVEDQQELNDKVANQQDQQDSEEGKPVETSSVEAAPIESPSDELIQDANQADKDVPEEPSDDVLPEPSLDEEDQAKPTEEDPEEEPSEGESQSA